MAKVAITERAAAVVARVRAERQGRLSFTIDGGCCEGTAPHLLEDAVLVPHARQIGTVAGVAVFLQPAMIDIYAAAEVTIDVIDEPMSDAMSLETEYGVRFVLR
ncbi:MAG TPA: DUF779 domain-containing protein [Terriglobales bacterium]|nr:DUF779 domain-containing protein [Terriglobales bacterium]